MKLDALLSVISRRPISLLVCLRPKNSSWLLHSAMKWFWNLLIASSILHLTSFINRYRPSYSHQPVIFGQAMLWLSNITEVGPRPKFDDYLDLTIELTENDSKPTSVEKQNWWELSKIQLSVSVTVSLSWTMMFNFIWECLCLHKYRTFFWL